MTWTEVTKSAYFGRIIRNDANTTVEKGAQYKEK